MPSMLPHAKFWRRDGDAAALPSPASVIPFAGRLGANQEFSLDKTNCTQAELLQKFPDAAPWIPWKDALSIRTILEPELWKAAVIEAFGTCFLVYLSIFVAIGLGDLVNTFATGALVPSLLAGVSAILILPLFIFATGPVSGAHLNPCITIATFFARLTSLPRCILYVGFQTFGGAMAGLLLRASFDTRSFTVPGCNIDPTKVSAGSAFAMEFVTYFAFIFLCFGVGLDPRQRSVFGPALGPVFIGIVLGTCTFLTGFSRPGYSGFSGNPARCFAAMVGSHFAPYHWVHWVAPITAAFLHGVLYMCIPPYSRERYLQTSAENSS